MTTNTDVAAPVVSSDAVPVDGRSLIIAGATPQDILANAETVAAALADLIEKQGLSIKVGTDRRTGEERKHVEVGGWQAAGAMLGALGGQALHAETVWSRRVARDDDLIVYESRAEVRTLDGEVVGSAESMCSSAERNWRSSDEFAVRGMAETRAESRAYRRAIGWVIKLAGYNPTPAEELPAGERDNPLTRDATLPTPAWAMAMETSAAVAFAENIVDLMKAAGVDEPDKRAIEIGQIIFDMCDGTIPVVAGIVVQQLADYTRTESTTEENN